MSCSARISTGSASARRSLATRVYNGALDNAAGVAALLDIAGQYRRQRARPRRSILFVALTGEEKGLLGSRWFARAPTVPRASIVANLNYDMALPLFPLTSIIILGAEESSLGADARAVERRRWACRSRPIPSRTATPSSARTSTAFIEEGIPAVAFKFGFAAGTPEAETERGLAPRPLSQPAATMPRRPCSARTRSGCTISSPRWRCGSPMPTRGRAGTPTASSAASRGIEETKMRARGA